MKWFEWIFTLVLAGLWVTAIFSLTIARIAIIYTGIGFAIIKILEWRKRKEVKE